MSIKILSKQSHLEFGLALSIFLTFTKSSYYSLVILIVKIRSFNFFIEEVFSPSVKVLAPFPFILELYTGAFDFDDSCLGAWVGFVPRVSWKVWDFDDFGFIGYILRLDLLGFKLCSGFLKPRSLFFTAKNSGSSSLGILEEKSSL